jgi:hypothetical protein
MLFSTHIIPPMAHLIRVLGIWVYEIHIPFSTHIITHKPRLIVRFRGACYITNMHSLCHTYNTPVLKLKLLNFEVYMGQPVCMSLPTIRQEWNNIMNIKTLLIVLYTFAPARRYPYSMISHSIRIKCTKSLFIDMVCNGWVRREREGGVGTLYLVLKFLLGFLSYLFWKLFIFPYLNVILKFLLVFFVIYFEFFFSPVNMFNPIPINISLGFHFFPQNL